MPLAQSGGSNVGSSQIIDGAIVNADINAAAAIDLSKIAFSGASVATAGGSITSNATATVAWNTENYDTDTYHDNVTNNSRLTVPSTGKYLITCSINLSSSQALIHTALLLRVDGTTNIGRQYTYATDAATTAPVNSANGVNLSVVISLTAGQYVEALLASNASGATLTYQAAGSSFAITKIGV